jgi:hypothetical protein
MNAVRRVNYNGADLTLRELSEAVGISLSCIKIRYHKGDRGPELWRPLDCVGGNKTGRPPSSLRGEGVSIKVREQAAERRAKQLAREVEKQARIDALKAARDAELRRPLIDAKLLKPREHKAIVDRVRFSGQRNWRKDGGATF